MIIEQQCILLEDMFLLLNKNLLTNLVKTYVVGVGLVKVYKALIRRALSVPFPMSMSEAFSVLFHFNKTLLPKSS